MLFVKIKTLLHTIKRKDFFSENDLFVRLVYGQDVRTTTIKWNTRDPVWNEAFVFDVQPTVKHIVVQLYEQGMYKSYKVSEALVSVNVGSVRPVKQHIFSLDIGCICTESKETVEKLRADLKRATDKVSHLVESVNTLQTQLDVAKQRQKETTDHHQQVSTSQEAIIERLQTKLTKILNFLENIKHDD